MITTENGFLEVILFIHFILQGMKQINEGRKVLALS